MRRWLRHHHGGVRGRISCESGNPSQLTAGWTAAARMERQEEEEEEKEEDEEDEEEKGRGASDSATINSPPPPLRLLLCKRKIRARVTNSLFFFLSLSFLSF
ncbi:hypothetical protein X777_11951 [Ooceraea biroi]|uniref:Uncharacterized protein n=1 Tax=Ooceraea biroi TaxID=2015173 RepID=A0A026W070_OOCBI|nr:hypothetical protein X777_11951 [Ooceraea biroi]